MVKKVGTYLNSVNWISVNLDNLLHMDGPFESQLPLYQDHSGIKFDGKKCYFWK